MSNEQAPESNPSRVLENNFGEFLAWFERTRADNQKNYEEWMKSDQAKDFGQINFHQYLMNLFFQTPQGGSFKRSMLACMVQELGEHKLVSLNKEKEVIEVPLKLLSAEVNQQPAQAAENQN
ncbi:MAG: hypothetical protein HQL32_10540 [Planctomycetes bacterium]|nr:hypothetical protein [Planctomycetota bacterium]